MGSASTDAPTRISRLAGTTTGAGLLIVLVLGASFVFNHSSPSGGASRTDATATSQLIEAESVVTSEGQLAATPTPAAVYAALNASSQLRGAVLYAATTRALQQTNTVYVDSSSKRSVILWDRSPSGHIWNVSMVANAPGMSATTGAQRAFEPRHRAGPADLDQAQPTAGELSASPPGQPDRRTNPSSTRVECDPPIPSCRPVTIAAGSGAVRPRFRSGESGRRGRRWPDRCRSTR